MKRFLMGPTGIMLALLIGCGVTFGLEMWWESAAPQKVEIKSLIVRKSVKGGLTLVVSNSAPQTRQCLRITQHVLYRDTPLDPLNALVPRDYVPLSSSLNGLGFNGVPNFTTELRIPEGIEPGVWQFSTRSVYLCSIFPGLMRITQLMSDPVEVEID